MATNVDLSPRYLFNTDNYNYSYWDSLWHQDNKYASQINNNVLFYNTYTELRYGSTVPQYYQLKCKNENNFFFINDSINFGGQGWECCFFFWFPRNVH